MAGKKKTDQNKQDPTFEQAMEQLERIIDDIESGDVTLDQSLEQFAAGMKLVQRCRGVLDRAEQKIKELTVDDQGDVTE